jgi:hypothetical protein
MHQDEVKLFRGNVETHLLRLQELSWRSGEFDYESPVEPEFDDDDPRQAPPLPETRKPWPAPVRAVNLILKIIGRRIWIAAIIVAAVMYWLDYSQLEAIEPYTWAAAGIDAVAVFIIALRQGARERDEELPRQVWPLPEIRSRQPAPVRAMNEILSIVARRFWIAAVVLLVGLCCMSHHQMEIVQPYLWSIAGVDGIVVLSLALQQALRERVR